MSERALHIPPAILALPDLSLLACAVLAEVLDLYRVNGQVFASDGHFATRLHSKPRTVRETIAELVTAGHLVREVNYAARHKRLLTPAQQWRIAPEVVADSATTMPEVVADSAGSSGGFCQHKYQLKEEVDAAHAAPPASSLPAKKSGASKPRMSGAALPDEVAALPLPHPGQEFGQLWAEFRAMPKQAKKPVTALRRLLATLGKYAEGFACLMLDKAIQGNWSGVEFDGTAAAYAAWQTAQAELARRQLGRPHSPAVDGPALNHEFLDQVATRQQDEENAHFARYARPAIDTNKEFGHTLTPAEGLAKAKQDPDYERAQRENAEWQAKQAQNPPNSGQPAP